MANHKSNNNFKIKKAKKPSRRKDSEDLTSSSKSPRHGKPHNNKEAFNEKPGKTSHSKPGSKGNKPVPAASTLKPHRKTAFPKPGNALYPAPAVMVTCRDPKTGENDIVTVGWAGNVCTNPPMLSISLRKSRWSYHMIRESGEFTVNLTTRATCKAADFCGVRSGRDVDKFRETGLTAAPGEKVSCPSILESPVSIECKVRQVIELGSHDLFIADVVNVIVDEAYFDESGAFRLDWAEPAAWSHGKYYALGEELGKFGFSIQKAAKKAKKKHRLRREGASSGE